VKSSDAIFVASNFSVLSVFSVFSVLNVFGFYESRTDDRRKRRAFLARIKTYRLKPAPLKAYDLWTHDRREFSSGDKCSDAIALGDREQKM
jgi:hypothetical protein